MLTALVNVIDSVEQVPHSNRTPTDRLQCKFKTKLIINITFFFVLLQLASKNNSDTAIVGSSRDAVPTSSLLFTMENRIKLQYIKMIS